MTLKPDRKGLKKGAYLEGQHASPGGQVGAAGVAAHEPEQHKGEGEEEDYSQPQPQMQPHHQVAHPATGIH